MQQYSLLRLTVTGESMGSPFSPLLTPQIYLPSDSHMKFPPSKDQRKAN